MINTSKTPEELAKPPVVNKSLAASPEPAKRDAMAEAEAEKVTVEKANKVGGKK